MKNEEEPDDARRSKKNQRSWFCINQTAEKISEEFAPKMNQDHRRGTPNIHWLWQSQSFKAWKSGGMREYFWMRFPTFYILGIFLYSLLGYKNLSWVDFFHWVKPFLYALCLTKSLIIIGNLIHSQKKWNHRGYHHVFSQSLCIISGTCWSSTHCCIYSTMSCTIRE